jgi:hypothetical protein
MGQAKLKAVRKEEKQARKGTVRLQSVKIEGQIVSYDEHGRAQSEGSGGLEPVFLMEVDIPMGVVEAIRKKFPKLVFDFFDPIAQKQDSA